MCTRGKVKNQRKGKVYKNKSLAANSLTPIYKVLKTIRRKI